MSGLLCCLPTINSQAQLIIGSTTAAGFTGQAAAVSGVAGGAGIDIADTGALAASGGALEAAALETNGGGLAVGASHAAVVGGGRATGSEATIANVTFAANDGFFGANTVTAAFVMSRAEAAASAAFGAVLAGAVQFDGLVVNSQAVAVTGAANQMVLLNGGGFVIINEQLAGYGTLTVNALHIVDAFAGVNVIIGAATAGVILGPTPTSEVPPPCDFVTGGGWISGTASGAKANFGVAGGIKDGAFWGHLNYIDHSTAPGMHVKATAVTGYSPDVDHSDLDCRIICYDVTVDGVPGYKARVRVCDKGEPGRDDVFEIKLYNGPPPAPCGDGTGSLIYSAGGDLGGSQPGGGNIQLHKCQ